MSQIQRNLIAKLWDNSVIYEYNNKERMGSISL